MSQKTNAGFNAPGFSVVASDPSGAAPLATSFAMLGSSLLPTPADPLASAASGVAQRANIIGNVFPFGFAANFK